MFHHLRKAFKWIEQPYKMVRHVIKNDEGGENYISSSKEFTIYANIQNKKDGESLIIGRDGSLVYRTILLLTKERIGIGDPVYPDGAEINGDDFFYMDNSIFNFMDGSIFEFDGEEPVLDTDPLIYYIKAFGQVYRITLEGGVQDLSYDPFDSSEAMEQAGYVYYRYYATLVRGPWQ